MKKSLLLFLFVAIVSIKSNAQTIHNGFVGNPVTVKDKLYLVYRTNGASQLVQFDGTNFKILIPNFGGYSKGLLFAFKDNLYFDCQLSGISQIAKLDGSTFTLFPVPNQGTFFAPGFANKVGEMAILNDALYFNYYDGNQKAAFAKFDGNIITPTPVNFDVSSSNMMAYNNALYFNVIGSDRQNELGRFDGKSVSVVPPTVNTVNSFASPQIVFNNELYINYLSGPESDQKQHLAKYDGTNITLIPNPDELGKVNPYNSVVFNNALYFEYQSWTNPTGSNQQLAKFDGNKIALIPNPNSDVRVYINGKNNLVVYNNAIYFEYYRSAGGVIRGENAQRRLAKYDGTKFTAIPNPDVEGKINSEPFLFNNDLYFFYSNYNGEGQLAKLNSVAGTIQIIDFKPTVAENMGSVFESDNYNNSDDGVSNLIYTTLSQIDKNTFLQGTIIIKIDQDGNVTGVTPLLTNGNDKLPQDSIDLLTKNFVGKKVTPYSSNSKNYPSHKRFFIAINYGRVTVMEKRQ